MADIAFIIYKKSENNYNELIRNISQIKVSNKLSVECVTVEGIDGYSSAYNLGMNWMLLSLNGLKHLLYT